MKASPGDMILWDSRTIHGGLVGKGQKAAVSGEETMEDNGPPTLARLSLTVCMTEKSRATESVLKYKLRQYEQGRTTTHWPHEKRENDFYMNPKAGITASTNEDYVHVPLEMTEEIKQLVGVNE